MEGKDLYKGEEISALYSKYRPSYPEEIYSKIFEYCKKNKHFEYDTIVDCGCGTGQVLHQINTKFKHCIGVDISETQISAGKLKNNSSNVEFKVGPCEDLSFLDDSSVDLITSATAFHWFDHEKFYKEVKRVLKPSGVIAVWSPESLGEFEVKEATIILDHLWQKIIAPSHSAYTQSYQHGYYAELILPFEDFEQDENIKHGHRLTLSGFVGWIKSTSPYQTYQSLKPDDDILEKFRNDMIQAYANVETPIENGSTLVMVQPISLLMGRHSKVHT